MVPCGYFDDPLQTTPAFDPGHSVPCPICDAVLSAAPAVAISLMPISGSRSYFFRAHKTCWNAATPERQSEVESEIIDAAVMGAQ